MTQIETTEVAYLLTPKDEIVHPIMSLKDGYGGHYHIWTKKGCYYWGVQIEARYITEGENSPKIRECSHIPPNVHRILKELPVL